MLAAITTTSAEYVEWITESMRRIFPREWDALAAASGRRPGERLIDAYLAPDHRPGPGRALRGREGVVRLGGRARLARPGLDAVRAVRRPEFRAQFATLVIHYWANSAFLPTDGILRGMPSIAEHPRA